jgi:hypothetical protein
MESAMTYEDHVYHREREQQCRELAERCADPDIRRRHFELAELHASRAASYMPPTASQAVQPQQVAAY